MRLLKRNIEKDGSGLIVCIPETGEDVWHLYNLLQVGDRVGASTYRKVTKESSTGSVSQSKKRMNLTVVVESIDFDPEELRIRVSGTNVAERSDVSMGAHHTLELEVTRKLELIKPKWDALHLERLKQACDPNQSADVVAVVLELGVGLVCLVTPHTTIVKSKISQSIPRKRQTESVRSGGGSSARSIATKKFFKKVLDALISSLDWTLVKAVVIASPGFVRDDFLKFVEEQTAEEYKELKKRTKQIVSVHVSAGSRDALNEVLAGPEMAHVLEDAKATAEVRALEEFFKQLNDDEAKAFYGYEHVKIAAERGAIKTLLVTDELFRAANVSLRAQYVELVENCRKANVQVLVFSRMHVSGERLASLTGVAAVLRFPMPDVLEDEM